GGTHAALVVAQRDGEVRRVDYDHVRFRDLLHHATAGDLLLHAADAPLHLRGALALFELVADLLPRHAQLPPVAEELPRHIDRSDDAESGCEREQRAPTER